MHSDYLSLEGPVEQLNGQLVLRIPLDAGGDRLRRTACPGCTVQGQDLIVPLPEWLAASIRLVEGAAVHVDDRWGRLNIARVH